MVFLGLFLTSTVPLPPLVKLCEFVVVVAVSVSVSVVFAVIVLLLALSDDVVVVSRAIVFFSQFALLTFLFFLKMYSAFWNVSASASSSSTGLSGLMITHTHKLTVMKLYYYLSLLLLFVIIIYYFS